MANKEETLKSLIDEFGEILNTNLNPKAIQQTLKDVDEQASSVMKTFGATREYSLAIKDNLAGAVSQVRALGGTMADVARIQSDVGLALGRNFITTKESIAQLYAAEDITKIRTETMINAFKNAGISALNAGDNMQKVVDTATKLGVNVGKTASMVVENMSLLNKYNFQGGVDGLAKMAAQAVNMRIDIKELAGVMEKAFEPESAIEMAAALQRLGVTQSDLLDPLRLLDLSQNDPAELQNQISEMTKSFVRMGEAGNFEIAPGGKRQLMEIAKAMNVPYETLTKMALSSFELEDKMKKIKFPSDMVKDEDKKFIANLAESKGGEYKVSVFDKKVGEVVEKSVSELSPDDVEELRKMATPKSMEDIAKEQLSYTKQIAASINSLKERTGLGLARSQVGEDFSSMGARLAKVVEDAASGDKTSSEAFKQMFHDQKAVIDKMIEQAQKEGWSTEKFESSMKEVFNKGMSTIKDAGSEMLFKGSEAIKNDDSINKFFGLAHEGIQKVLGEGVNRDTQGVKKQRGNDVIKMPGQEIELHPQDTIMAATGLEQLINFMKNPMQNPGPTDNMSSLPKDVNVNVNFNGQNMPSNIDTNQLVLTVKNDQTLRQAIVEAVQSTIANNNLTPKGSLPQQGSMFAGYGSK